MVPIHDTDVAEERWSQAEWENYELWEKVELKLKRKKQLWILATVLVFLALSAVPIVVDRLPKWMTRSVARTLAQEINRIKREASTDRVAYRLKFPDTSKLDYVVEKLPSCGSQTGEVVRTGNLFQTKNPGDYSILNSSEGITHGVPGLIDRFCYDSLSGSSAELNGETAVGFGIIPVKDLTEKRMDRLTVLLLTGSSAEISFD